MKNSQSIRKIIFVSNKNIALVVFDTFENQNFILFADQVSLANADLKVKINQLLTNAANFLGFNIKEVELIFDDSEIKSSNHDYELPDCNDEKEITREIYKYAKCANEYVNEINFNNIIYDDIEKKAIVNCDVVSSNYCTFKKFEHALKECNLNIVNATNIYTLLNNKQASSEIVINLLNGKVVVSEYAIAKLVNVSNFELELPEIYSNLSNKFNISVDNVKQMIKLANKLEAGLETQTLLSLNFDISHRIFNGIKACDLIEAYQAEINFVIGKKFNLNNYSEVRVITNESINKLANAKVQQFDQIIGLENIDADKLLALVRIDSNSNENTHYKFEKSINGKIHSVGA